MTDSRFGLLSLIIGIVALSLSVYFWLDSKSYPSLLVVAQPIRATLVSSKLDRELTISHRGEVIKGPVTALQIAVWNNGTREVRPQDVLEPIQISLNPTAKIVAVEIKRLTRPVTNLRIDKSKFSEGVLLLSWDILEPNDGAALQITYIGDETVSALATGAIIGQRTIELRETPLLTSPRRQISERDPWWRRMFAPFADYIIHYMLFVLVMLLAGSLGNRIARPNTTAVVLARTARIIALVAMTFFIVFIIVAFVGMAISFFTAPPNPPFSF